MTDPIWEKDRKLKQHLSPVLDAACPFAGDVDGGEIEHFKQGLIRRENAFSLRHFTQLAVVTLNHICHVDKFADFRGVLENGSEFLPIIPSGTDNKWIFGSPHLFKTVEFVAAL
ncbi:hypothetical protein J2T20_003625 [Paenibacillus wynnii]|nr:hypothetical protein [Paenibacillus wynnii]